MKKKQTAPEELIEAAAPAEARARTITTGAFDPDSFEVDTCYRSPSSPKDCLSVPDLMKFVEAGTAEIEARVLFLTKDGLKIQALDNAKFKEAYKKPGVSAKFRETARSRTSRPRVKIKGRAVKPDQMREAVDSFMYDGDQPGPNGLVGDDFIPLLGGPFNKQLYYADYLKMHAVAFQTFHHDPVAKRIINLIRQFTLGRGFRCDVNGKDEALGTAIW